jgi:hypothetical protein
MRAFGWAATALALVAVASAAMQEATVRLRVTAGEEIKYKSVTKSTLTIAGPMDMTTNSTNSMVRTFKVGENKEGWNAFTISHSDVKMETDSDMSAMGQGSPEEIAKLTQGLQVSGEVNEMGAVRNITVKGGDTSDPMVMMALGGVGQAMTDLGLMGIRYPAEGLKVGTTWTQKFFLGRVISETMGGMISSNDSVDVEYKVVSVEDFQGKMHAVITATTNGTIKVESMMAGEGTMAANSTNKIWLDLQTGIVTKSEGKQTSTVELPAMGATATMEATTSETRVTE